MTARLQGRRIACAHLYDDFSGSAKIFSQAVGELIANGAAVRVTVGSAGASGFIREAHRADTAFYRFSENGAALLASFTVAQVLLFLKILRLCLFWKADTVYVNTSLAPGAVLAGWLCRRRVIVHLHEIRIGSRALFALSLGLARAAAHRLICVSEFTRAALDLPAARTVVVYNSLGRAEWSAARTLAAARDQSLHAPFVVLMASALKWYKGIDSFLALASHCADAAGQGARQLRFSLLLNCEAHEWQRFAAQHSVPANLQVTLRPPAIIEHYGAASLVMNLSHRERCIETFGMTLLEAMACGTPAISPLEGGCTELVEEGRGGWRIDSRDLDGLAARVRALAQDPTTWLDASRAARVAAERFSPEAFAAGLLAVFAVEAPARA